MLTNLKRLSVLLLALIVMLTLSVTVAQDEGSTLNWAISQTPRNMNPLDGVQGVQAAIIRLTYDSLIEYNIGFFTEPIPALAESWEASDDSLSFTFNLRDDVVWHDGEPFTADDVAFTLTAAVHPDNPTFWGSSLKTLAGYAAFESGEAESISGIEVVDDFTIRLTLEQPSLSLLDTLAFVGMLPEHILGDVPFIELKENAFFSSNPIGTGPYQVAEVVEDQYIRFERNEAYYRGTPSIETIFLRFLDASTIAAGLETGQIDITNSVPAEDFVRFVDNPNFNVYWHPGNVFCNISANASRIPKAIRQAISFAIDREAITDELYLGSQLSTPFYHHLAHEFLQPNPFEQEISYNPDRARELIDSAIANGEWEADRSIDFVFQGEQVSDELLFIVQYLQDIGLNASLRGLGDRAAYNAAVLEEMNYDLVTICNAFGPDPDSVTIYYQSGYTYNDGGFNFTQFSNARADEILAAARTETDSAARIALYQELQGILDDEQTMVPIRRLRVGWVMRSNVNATPQHFGHLPNYDAVETWTIAGS